MNFGEFLMKSLEGLGRWIARPRPRLAKFVAITTVIVALPLAGLVMLPTILSVIAPPLDTTQDLYAVNRPIAFTFLDSEGKQIGHRGAIVGDRLKLEEMPAYLPAAFIAMEDRRFYSHPGIDIHGLLRAMWTNFRAHHVVQGGSTITQQTAKIVFLSPQRTFQRKLEELMDAERLEKSLSKKQILELYLNRIYLGSGAYGVDGAARVYFGKSARDVSLSEAAMLATLTTAPSVFSPRRDLAAAQNRASLVLHEMVKTGAITKEQAEEARAHPAVVSSRTIQDARNFFLDTAAEQAMQLASVNGKAPTVDLVVHTTLEPRLQEDARHALNRVLAKEGHKVHASEGAIVLMKVDGSVSALIGGRDYDESMFNRATQARRQPGSAFKPFVYLAAVENGISPWDVRSDGPVDIDGWSPTNYGGRSYGTITLASALAHSVNTITASVAQEVGISQVVEAAQRLGITSPLEQNASLALGTSEVTPLELTTAYAAFASGGLRINPYFVTEVDDGQNHVLYHRQGQELKRVIASHVNRDLTAMLYGVITEGTGRGAAIPGHEAAGKTGTTQDYHDAWFVGFTSDYVAGVWVGNDDSTPMRNVTGGTIPAEIWRAVMTSAEDGLPAKPLDKSEPQAPTDENGIITAESGGASVEGATLESPSVDDETGGASEDNNGDTDENSSERSNTRRGDHDRSWWDWLFGSGGSNSSTHPPQPHAEASPPPRPQYGEPQYGQPQPRTEYASPPPQPRSRIEGPVTTYDSGTQGGSAPVTNFYVQPRRVAPLHDDNSSPPPPPRAGRAPPPPPDADDEGAHHPDGDDGDPGNNQRD